MAARALATYLIPGCVGRGVRLGSESSSGSGGAGAGGGRKSGNLEIWEFGDLGTWKSRNPPRTQKKNISKSKSILPKLSNGPSFHGPKKNKTMNVFLGGPMGPIHPVWALAAIHPRWGNRYSVHEE